MNEEAQVPRSSSNIPPTNVKGAGESSTPEPIKIETPDPLLFDNGRSFESPAYTASPYSTTTLKRFK